MIRFVLAANNKVTKFSYTRQKVFHHNYLMSIIRLELFLVYTETLTTDEKRKFLKGGSVNDVNGELIAINAKSLMYVSVRVLKL